MDPDEQPAPPSEHGGPAPSDADPAPVDEAGAGSAATEEPPASDAYGHDETLVGDFTASDVDLSHLVPADDGDPDDEEPPAEKVEQDATGQAVVWDDTDPGLPTTPAPVAHDEPTEPTA